MVTIPQPTELDYCQECGTPLLDLPPSTWWADEDGVYAFCPGCHLLNFRPWKPKDEEPTEKAATVELNEAVQVAWIPPELDYCRECGASLQNLPTDMWWADQDGIYAVCQECGTGNFWPCE